MHHQRQDQQENQRSVLLGRIDQQLEGICNASYQAIPENQNDRNSIVAVTICKKL